MRDFLFAYYRDRYGEYQARRLLLLDRKERRTRVQFLERQKTSDTDFSQPLWPELNHARREMLEFREQCINAITRKNHLPILIVRKSQEIDAARGDRRPEAEENLRRLSDELESLKVQADESIQALLTMKQIANAREARYYRIRKANELIRLPPPMRADAANRG